MSLLFSTLTINITYFAIFLFLFSWNRTCGIYLPFLITSSSFSFTSNQSEFDFRPLILFPFTLLSILLYQLTFLMFLLQLLLFNDLKSLGLILSFNLLHHIVHSLYLEFTTSWHKYFLFYFRSIYSYIYFVSVTLPVLYLSIFLLFHSSILSLVILSYISYYYFYLLYYIYFYSYFFLLQLEFLFSFYNLDTYYKIYILFLLYFSSVHFSFIYIIIFLPKQGIESLSFS